MVLLCRFCNHSLPNAMREADRLPGRTEDTHAIPVWTSSDDTVDAFGVDMDDEDRLSELACESSAFGFLMSDLLVLRHDIAAVVITFAVGVVSPSMIDIGIGHGEFCRFLQDICRDCVQALELICMCCYLLSDYNCMHTILRSIQWA